MNNIVDSDFREYVHQLIDKAIRDDYLGITEAKRVTDVIKYSKACEEIDKIVKAEGFEDWWDYDEIVTEDHSDEFFYIWLDSDQDFEEVINEMPKIIKEVIDKYREEMER